MARIEVNVDTRQIEQLFSQLRLEDQRRLAQRVAAQEADRIREKIRRKIRALGFKEQDIARIVAEVRQGRYARGRR